MAEQGVARLRGGELTAARSTWCTDEAHKRGRRALWGLWLNSGEVEDGRWPTGLDWGRRDDAMARRCRDGSTQCSAVQLR